MNGVDCLFTLPADLEDWILLGYAAAVLVGARVTEVLARVHFARARRLAESARAQTGRESEESCVVRARRPRA